MNGMEPHLPARVHADVRAGSGSISVEYGLRYRDGYVVEVWWEKDDATWYAQLSGANAQERVLGDGPTKEAALCSLCCSLAALSDALWSWLPENQQPPKKRKRKHSVQRPSSEER